MIDEHTGIKRHAEEMGHSTRVGALGFHLGKRRTAGATSARDTADDRTMRPATADTLVAHEEGDYPEEKADDAAAESGPGLAMGDIADTTGPAALETREHKIRSSSSLNHFPPQNHGALSRRKISQKPDTTTVNLNNLDTDLYDDYNFADNGKNNNADNEILEVPRGREGHDLGMSITTNRLPPAFRRTMSASSLVSGPGTGRMATRGLSSTTSPPPTPPPISPRSSSILPPIFPSLNTIPLSHSPHSQPGSRSRPRTAPNTGFMDTPITPSSPLVPTNNNTTTTSRPGTGDSATGSIRHHRLDSVRGRTVINIPHGHIQGHRSTPPTTRDSSPSRSVRFVDYVDGESGHVGTFGPVVGGSSGGGGNDNEGRESASRGY